METRIHRFVRMSMVALAALCWVGQANAQTQSAAQSPQSSRLLRSTSGVMRMRSTTNAQREAAAKRVAERKAAAEAKRRQSAPVAAPAGGPSAMRGAVYLLQMALGQVGTPDLYNVANYANSPLPVRSCSISGAPCVGDFECQPVMVGTVSTPQTCSGAITGGGIHKFVDPLPGLCPVTGKTANTGQCIPVATPDTTTYAGSDYYVIGLRDYTEKMHRDLPVATQLRGYYQKNAPAGALDPEASNNHYLGPLILAQRNRPVRVKLVNELGFTGNTNTNPTLGPVGDGHLFIPVDPTIPGAGKGPLDATGAPCNPQDPVQAPNCASYPQNRATLHLHGGNTPWISDGTQHQWAAPAGEPTVFKKGLTTRDVPDMTPTVAGEQTFYWTNQQSGRLMFYHDHAYGITRLNVYVGEAAGYLLYDPTDEDLLKGAGVPGTLTSGGLATWDLAHLVPLVIQDKTFVPAPAQLAVEDPTWDTVKWGGTGQLWFPHVYTPNQWPTNPDLSGANPMGRWDYGPWFFPPQTSLTAGQLEVPCATMAGVPTGGTPLTTMCPGTPNPSIVPESFMDTMIVNGTAYPTLTVNPTAYRLQILNAANERNLNLSFFKVDATGAEVPMVPAVPHMGQTRNGLVVTGPTALPAVCPAGSATDPATGLPAGSGTTCWPNNWPLDARPGGVPDPAAAGPQIIQIGSEGGILPAPAVIPPQPVDYEYNRRNIVVLNVSSKALFMGPAERADVIVDFSAFANQDLILYNDSPAPVPGFDTRLDYFTGGPDQTSTGGAPTTQPGYGPNTRTIMKIHVNAGTPAAFTPTNLATTMGGIFRAKQPTPIVPEAGLSTAFGTTFANTYLPIQSNSLTFTPVCASTVPASCPQGQPTPLTLTFGQKAIQELFDTDYGRMNATLGVEIPITNFLTQTTIPFANFDPPTEFITDNQPQIWKITHNGVDTHTIHFHLLNAQVINRVGWDGAIRPPDANELGWKDSVRMHPLEDIFVALQPVKQSNLPWPLPDMIRPLDVTLPLGTSTQFTGVDINNLPITVTNQLQNFGWEYVWHCHLLGHEEGDMLRAEVFVVAPETPSNLAGAETLTGTTASVRLTWTDSSKSAMSFTIQRATDSLFTVGLTTFAVAAPTVTYLDTTAAANTAYYYRVRAEKVLSSAAIPGSTFPSASGWSNVVQVAPTPIAGVSPTTLSFGNQPLNTTSPAQTVTLSNTGTGVLTFTTAFGGAAPGDFAQSNTCGGSVAPGGSCAISVTFRPTVVGQRGATLTITTNDPSHPTLTVTLSGNGTSVASGLAIDVTASRDVNTAGAAITTPSFTTRAANELLLAFVSADAPAAGTNTRVTGVTNTGGSLIWVLVQRTNVQRGTAEIWRTFAPTARTATVTATFNQSAGARSITVVTFTGTDTTGASGAGAIGAFGGSNAAAGAPTASLVTTRANSWVFGVGTDWDNAIPRTLGPSQTMVHQDLSATGDTYWVQRQTSTTPLAGTSVTINDTAPTGDRYNLSIVEVRTP
jgi:FtsP/CotA-like multicopper oxidase with cupredoxin domain